MNSRRLPALNVQDTPTSYGQRIGDQRAMTPRHECLGAHDRGHPFSRPGLKVPQPALKVLRDVARIDAGLPSLRSADPLCMAEWSVLSLSIRYCGVFFDAWTM
jgi:hypothetical protein